MCSPSSVRYGTIEMSVIIVVLMMMEISKVPTMQPKALKNHTMTYTIIYIEMENVIHSSTKAYTYSHSLLMST